MNADLIAAFIAGMTGVFGVAWALLFWTIKNLHDDVRSLERSVSKLEITLATAAHCAAVCANFKPRE